MKVARPTRRGALRGFTLLELLVAAALTALIASIIAVVVTNISGFWSRSSSRLAAEAQARYIFDQLALDLQSALRDDEPRVWLAADVITNANDSGLWDQTGMVQKPADAAGTTLRYDADELADATFGRGGMWLRFFTQKRGNNLSADTLAAPVAVGWQIVRRKGTNASGAAEPGYFLHRAEASPTRTLDAGFEITAAVYATSSPSATVGEPGAVRSPPLASVIGENVIDFGIRFHAEDSAGALAQIFPRGTEFSYRANSAHAGASESPFPDVVDVQLRILSDEGARMIAALERGAMGSRPPDVATDEEYWWRIALAHSRVFTRRIEVAFAGR